MKVKETLAVINELIGKTPEVSRIEQETEDSVITAAFEIIERLVGEEEVNVVSLLSKDNWDAPDAHAGRWMGLKLIGHQSQELLAEAHFNPETCQWNFTYPWCRISVETFEELVEHVEAAHAFKEMV
jgi:hypothetical protein